MPHVLPQRKWRGNIAGNDQVGETYTHMFTQISCLEYSKDEKVTNYSYIQGDPNLSPPPPQENCSSDDCNNVAMGLLVQIDTISVPLFILLFTNDEENAIRFLAYSYTYIDIHDL